MNFLVRKRSGKPFKSGLTTNTVIGMITHPTTGNLAYIFKEDKSWVEVKQCERVWW